MAEEDIQVSIEDDENEDGVVKTEEKQDAAVADLKAQHEQMLASERQRAEAAEQRAQQARQREEAARRDADSARTEVADSQLDTVAQGIAAAQAEAESAEREYKAAFEAGDAGAMATAQRKLARAEARSVRLDEAKVDLEARKAAPQPARIEAPQPDADPVEAYISGRTAPTQNWLRAHKDWITDPIKNAQLTSAHWDAVAKKLAPDTPEYFDHVEKTIGLKEAPKANGGAPPPPPRRGSGPPVAPVRGSSGGGSSGGDNEVFLTKREAASATDGTLVWNFDDPTGQKKFRKGDPIGIQEMARRKRDMTKRGLYTKQYTEA